MVSHFFATIVNHKMKSGVLNNLCFLATMANLAISQIRIQQYFIHVLASYHC